MSVKADWHTPDVALDDDGWDEPERIERVGTPIELNATGDRAELNRELLDTMEREQQLADQGVTCAIKDKRDSSCHACPLFSDDGSPDAELCAIGRRQERLCTQIIVSARGGRR